MSSEFFSTPKIWNGEVSKLFSGRFAVTSNCGLTVYETMQAAEEYLAELTGSTVTKVLGGTIYELLSGQSLAVSHYDREPARFDSFEEAGQWLLDQMDSATTKLLGGEVRELSTGQFVALSHHLIEPTFHDTLEAAAALLAWQENLARSAGQ